MQTLMTEQAEVILRDVLTKQSKDEEVLAKLQQKIDELSHKTEEEKARLNKTALYLKRLHKTFVKLDQTLVA